MGELGPQKAMHATMGSLDFPLGPWGACGQAADHPITTLSILCGSLRQRVEVDQKGPSPSLGSRQGGGAGGGLGRGWGSGSEGERGHEADSKRQVWKASRRPRPVPVIGWKREGRLMGFLGCMMSREIEGAPFPGSWSSPQCLSQRSPCMCPKENSQGISLQYCL